MGQVGGLNSALGREKQFFSVSTLFPIMKLDHLKNTKSNSECTGRNKGPMLICPKGGR